MGINRKYRIRMEVITPLHVGAASEKHYKEGQDFFYNERNRQVVFINHHAIMNSRYANSYVNYLLNADYNQIKNLVNQNQAFALRRVPLSNRPGGDIKAHVRNGLNGKPIVPGSSIKGALRSVLFNHLRDQNDHSNEAVFGSLQNHDDFMRFIRVGDAQFDSTSLVTAKIFNVHLLNNEWIGGWKHARHNNNSINFQPQGFTTTYEVIPNESEAHFELMLSDVVFDLFYRNNRQRMHNHERKHRLLHNGIGHLFGIVNNYTRRFIQREIAFFERYNQAQRSDVIVDNLVEYLLPLTEEPNSCLMRMASGSGFHAITGDWQFNDHVYTVEHPVNNRRYKSRRISFTNDQYGWIFLPMGFVLLTHIPD